MMEQPQTHDSLGSLTIVVCVKQVPHPATLCVGRETRHLLRAGIPLAMNELDVYALTEAIRLRNMHGGEVIAVTTGPAPAREALVTALAMGADRALHLHDHAFGGADTIATAHALAFAIQCIIPTFDLILCGRQSIDSETAQVGPQIAELLHLPQVSAAQKITVQQQQQQYTVIAQRETDGGNETLLMPLPALITTVERLNEGIWPDEQALRQARERADEHIRLITAAELSVDHKNLGQKGSPTWVAEVILDAHPRAGRIIAESDPARTVALLIKDLEEHQLLAPHTASAPAAAPRRKGAPLSGRAVWVIAECDTRGIRHVTRELLSKGNDLAAVLQGELATLLIGGPGIATQARTLAAYGAERVYIVEDPSLQDYTTERYTAAVTAAIQRYQPTIVLLSATANDRNLTPRVAARLQLGLAGGCIYLSIDEHQRLVQHKPAFGGSIISLIVSDTTPAMATLRPGMFTVARPDFALEPVIERLVVPHIDKQIRTQIIGQELYDTGVAGLESAHTILGVGLGMGDPVSCEPLYQLAELLDAGIGATRAVTDKGWLPKQAQIGLTGRTISPRLYIALGVHGAVEHIAGIRKAGYIVSINKEKQAAILRYSDLGVIGDVHILLPLLVEQLAKREW